MESQKKHVPNHQPGTVYLGCGILDYPIYYGKKIMFQTTNQHSFVSEMSEIHPTSSDKRENNGLKVQFHR
jgi:hypothetical protein